MFRHPKRRRTHWHNLKLASILSGVAGIVNIIGVLSIDTLTTNVTGHFAFFSEVLLLGNYTMATVYICFLLCFLLGAFVTGTLTELVSKHNYHLAYIIPVSLEIAILVWAGLFYRPAVDSAILLASTLLFAMGLQNALVTKISRSVVRTTHLTGLFTDLGIELSQLFRPKKEKRSRALRQSISLKLAIISCFFVGGIMGGYLYMQIGVRAFLLPAALLVIALRHDRIMLRYYYLKRKYRKY